MRYFYAAKSTMGTNYTYDSPCWYAYRFGSKKERDEWVATHEYKDGNRVAEAVSRSVALRIIGYKSSKYAESCILEDSHSGALIFLFC